MGFRVKVVLRSPPSPHAPPPYPPFILPARGPPLLADEGPSLRLGGGDAIMQIALPLAVVVAWVGGTKYPVLSEQAAGRRVRGVCRW
jgi:hypothetical protein